MADDDPRAVKPKDETKPELEITDQAPSHGLEEGWRALERGDTKSARALAARSLVETPNSADALLLEAACARDEGDNEQAITLLRRVCKLDSEWCTPELWLAELLAASPDTTAEALGHAGHALDLADEEEEYLNALVLKAGLEAELGEVDEAKETLRDLPPPEVSLGDPLLALEIAELWLAVGEPEAARDRLRTLTKSEPEMADAWYTLGLAAEALDDHTGMRSAWKRAWQLDAASADEDAVARLDEGEVLVIVEQALGELPEKARRLLVDVPSHHHRRPAGGDRRRGRPGSAHARALQRDAISRDFERRWSARPDPDRAVPAQPGASGGER